MASYSKQMMDLAKTWLAANPDPASPFLKIPWLDKYNPHEVHRTSPEQIARAAKRPDVAALVQQLREAEDQAAAAQEELHAMEDKLERLVNVAPLQAQQKSAFDQRDVGRWCLAWARYGYNVFELSSDFTAAMLLTDAHDLDIADVRLPFRGILMLVPDGFARGVEGASYTKIHITEIPRGDIQQLDAMNHVADLVGQLSPDARKSVFDDIVRVDRVTELTRVVGQRVVGQRTDSLLAPRRDADALHIYASDGAHVLETLIDRKGLSWGAFDDLADTVEDADDRRARHTLRQIVFGTLAYMSAVTTATERVDVPAKKKRNSSDEPTITRWTVGRTIKIDKELVHSVRAGAREVAFRLKSRFIVRGHYRNQAHGPGRVDRTRIWISPFWRGPEDGAELVHTYKPIT